MTTTISSNSSTSGTDYSRITGLSSGLDVEGIVTSLVKAASVPKEELEQQKQILEWQQEDYRSLNGSLFDFRATVYSMKLSTTYTSKEATSANQNIAEVSAGSNAVDGTYSITVNNLAAGVSKGSSAALAEEKDGSGNALTIYDQFSEFAARGLSATDTVTVTINGAELEFDLDQDNISTVVAKINSADLGIKASYDSNLNRFFLTTTSTGSDASISVSSDSANFLASGTNDSILKLSVEEGTEYRGQNASIDFGDAAGIESSTNTITVNGIAINLKATGATNVLVSQDVSSIVDSIKTLIDSYNEVLDKFYTKVKEDRNYDYAPLTDAQKKDMSDEEIEIWTQKAHCGLLSNDSMLNSLISNLRQSVFTLVSGISGDYNSLSEIGIRTKSYDDNGKLYIDETKLREAIGRDPEGLMELFANNEDGAEGIAVRLHNAAANGITMLSNKAGSDSNFSTVDNSYIGKRLTELGKNISSWETKLDNLRNQYYKKFDAMETAINTMNSQSQWLAAQFGSSSS